MHVVTPKHALQPCRCVYHWASSPPAQAGRCQTIPARPHPPTAHLSDRAYTCYDLKPKRHTVSQETPRLLTKRRAGPAAPAQMAPSRRDGQHAVRVGLNGRDRYCGLWCYGVISCLCATHSHLLHWQTYRYILTSHRCLLAGKRCLSLNALDRCGDLNSPAPASRAEVLTHLGCSARTKPINQPQACEGSTGNQAGMLQATSADDSTVTFGMHR